MAMNLWFMRRVHEARFILHALWDLMRALPSFSETTEGPTYWSVNRWGAPGVADPMAGKTDKEAKR